MAKKQFKIRAKFVFGGQLTVRAHSRQEAEAIAEGNIAAMLGRVEVQPAAEDDIRDWEFSTHGETVINRKQREEDQ